MDNKLITKHEDYNNNIFNRVAKYYNFLTYFLFPLRKKVLKFTDFGSPMKILDVATGTGAQAYEFAKAGHEVIGVDLSEGMLEKAERRRSSQLNLKFVKANSAKLPFRDNTFDVSTISFGLHEMPYELGVETLKEMKRVTKSGGNILIVDYEEPRSGFLAKIRHLFTGLYELKYYDDFMSNGLGKYFKEVGLKPYRTKSLLGFAQLILIKNP